MVGTKMGKFTQLRTHENNQNKQWKCRKLLLVLKSVVCACVVLVCLNIINSAYVNSTNEHPSEEEDSFSSLNHFNIFNPLLYTNYFTPRINPVHNIHKDDLYNTNPEQMLTFTFQKHKMGKRSIENGDKSEKSDKIKKGSTPNPFGFGSMRVFKYVTEDQVLNFNNDNSITENENSRNSISKKVQKSKNNKSQISKVSNTPKISSSNPSNKIDVKNKGVNSDVDKVWADPILNVNLKSRAQSVTDRSLIPNSFFGPDLDSESEGQKQKNINLKNLTDIKNKNHHNQNQHQPTSTSTPYYLSDLNDNIATATDAIESVPKLTKEKDESFNTNLAQSNNTNSNDTNYLDSMSERSRRSPFGVKNPKNPNNFRLLRNPNQNLRNNKKMQISMQQVRGINPKNRNQFPNPNPNQKTVNRAALYLRTGINPNNPNQNGPNRNQNPNSNVKHFQPKFPIQNGPNGPNQHQMQMNKAVIQGPGHFLQHGPNANNRGVAVVVPNPNQNQNVNIKLTPPGPLTKLVMPSPSTDFYQYRDPHTNMLVEEPTWNHHHHHPMYRKYSKVAKRVQNKVSGYMRPKGQDHSSRRGEYKYRTDHSKMPQIPLPRPSQGGNKGRRIRSRHKGQLIVSGPPPGVRYSYPKSAQNIQDILNHFKSDNNEIYDAIGAKGAGSRYHTNPYQNNNRIRDRERGPPAISDLSSELKDVRFSLMRDIREFAKRPSNYDSPPEEHEEPDRHYPEGDLPEHIKPLREDDPLPWGKKYDNEHENSRHDHIDDPHSPGYNHEDGFDEIFNPKPKPVREMIKKSSKFRQEMHMDRDNDYEKEYQHSRKKERPLRDHDEIQEHENEFVDSPYYHQNLENDETHSRFDTDRDRDHNEQDSTESYSQKSIKRLKGPPRLISSVEIEIQGKGRGKKRNKNKGTRRPKDPSSLEMERPVPSQRPRDREISNNDRDYPKSIRDKLGDHPHSSIEYLTSPKMTRNRFDTNPVVLKRPYETYAIPPQMMDLEANLRKKVQNHEFWNNYASATEKSSYGYPTPSNIHNFNYPGHVLNSMPSFVLPPPVTTSASGTLNPFYLNNLNNLNNQRQTNQLPIPLLKGIMPTPDPEHEDEDILEIHAGQVPGKFTVDKNSLMGQFQTPNMGHNPHDHNSNLQMQNAYLELLQHKMQSDASLMNNQPKMNQNLNMNLNNKKGTAPMRMKIHIYPNEDGNTEISSTNQNPNQNQNNQNGMQMNPNSGISISGHHQNQNPGYFTRSPGPEYSNNMVSFMNPHFNQKIGGSMRNNVNMNMGMGPGPSSGMHNPNMNYNGRNGHVSVVSNSNGDKASISSNSNDKNKNLVLHLHVHRRNDVGPVELEAEASEHFPSTAKPLTYKEIYDEHTKNQQDKAHLANHNHETDPGGEPEGDKSVSMEVPIHDDKIEDVLHTLLQFRDRTATRRRRRK